MKNAPWKPELLVDLMASLSDPKRLRLLRLLEQHELGVAELCDVLQSPQSSISRHLKVLLDQGWLRARASGTTHFYRAVPEEMDSPAKKLWLTCREQLAHWPAVAQDQIRLDGVLRQRQSSESFFAGAAAQWDVLRAQLYGQSFSAAACLALLSENQVVADLGCGTGPIIAEIAPHVGRVIGVDNSPAMLRSAQRRLAPLANVELRRGDLAEIPVESSSCDAAMLVLALTYVADPPAVLRQMSRILRLGGKAIVVDLLPHDREDFRRQFEQRWQGFELDQISRWLKDAGFQVLSGAPLAPEQGVKGPALFLASARKTSDLHGG